MREEEFAAKSRKIQVTLTVAVKSSGDISAEPVRGQKIEEDVGTHLDLAYVTMKIDLILPAVQ